MVGGGKNRSGWNCSVCISVLLLLLAVLPDSSSCVVLGSPSILPEAGNQKDERKLLLRNAIGTRGYF